MEVTSGGAAVGSLEIQAKPVVAEGDDLSIGVSLAAGGFIAPDVGGSTGGKGMWFPAKANCADGSCCVQHGLLKEAVAARAAGLCVLSTKGGRCGGLSLRGALGVLLLLLTLCGREVLVWCRPAFRQAVELLLETTVQSQGLVGCCHCLSFSQI